MLVTNCCRYDAMSNAGSRGSACVLSWLLAAMMSFAPACDSVFAFGRAHCHYRRDPGEGAMLAHEAGLAVSPWALRRPGFDVP